MATAPKGRRESGDVAASALDAYEIHEAANLFPLIDAENLNALAEDIRTNGQQEPIWMYQGKLLDGRNRVLACAIAGVTPLRQEWKPRPGETPTAFVMSRNLHRRHLAASQRAAIAVELQEVLIAEREAAKQKKPLGVETPFSHPSTAPVALAPADPAPTLQFTNAPEVTEPRIDQPVIKGKSRDQAASALNVSSGYVNDAKDIKKASPEMFDKVKAGEVTLSKAQDAIVADALSRGALDEVTLRPGVVRTSLSRVGDSTVIQKKQAQTKPRIRLPKASKVTSSATTVAITATFGNPTIAEEWLNKLQDDKRVLDLDYTLAEARPRKRTNRSKSST